MNPEDDHQIYINRSTTEYETMRISEIKYNTLWFWTSLNINNPFSLGLLFFKTKEKARNCHWEINEFLVYIKFNLLGNLAQTKNYIKSFATQISLYLCKYSQFFMNKNLNKEESFFNSFNRFW